MGRLVRGVSIEAARAELLARWPSIQSQTLPAALSDAGEKRCSVSGWRLRRFATGFSALRGRYGTTLWVLLALMGFC